MQPISQAPSVGGSNFRICTDHIVVEGLINILLMVMVMLEAHGQENKNFLRGLATAQQAASCLPPSQAMHPPPPLLPLAPFCSPSACRLPLGGLGGAGGGPISRSTRVLRATAASLARCSGVSGLGPDLVAPGAEGCRPSADSTLAAHPWEACCGCCGCCAACCCCCCCWAVCSAAASSASSCCSL